MDRTLKRWELALILGILCALVLGTWLRKERQHALELSAYVLGRVERAAGNFGRIYRPAANVV